MLFQITLAKYVFLMFNVRHFIFHYRTSYLISAKRKSTSIMIKACHKNPIQKSENALHNVIYLYCSDSHICIQVIIQILHRNVSTTVKNY